ncbi:MAG: hypothetical protein AMS15_00890 [Planctomycetes bacterium DG_23]|nr:MAG: hypothetical protein AMS15_00890 [Planctomycetes bacterium DG_23]
MADKPGFWGVWVVPWSHPYRFIFYVLVGICLLLAVLLVVGYLAWGQVPSITLWWSILPASALAVALLTSFGVRLLVQKVSKKLPGGALLRSPCVVVYGIWETPGIVQISPDRLVIKPLLRREFLVPLRKISAIREHRYYNGRPYWGRTLFFELTVPQTVSNEWRLGFGVEDAERWRKLLYAPTGAV